MGTRAIPGAKDAPAKLEQERAGLAGHPLPVFFTLAFVISWLPVIPYAMGAFPSTNLAFGPFVAAVITSAIVGGRAGVGDYFRRLFRWRVGVRWYALAFLGPVLALALLSLVNVWLGASPPTSAALSGWSLIITATLGFLINPFGGAWEEPGWRGYALPRLLERQSALGASAVLGIVWAIWHVPLFIIGAIPWADAPVVFGFSFVFTILFLRTGGSFLIAFLLHASINGAGEFFIPLFTGGDRVRMYWLMAVLSAVIAALAYFRNGPDLVRKSSMPRDGRGAVGARSVGVQP